MSGRRPRLGLEALVATHPLRRALLRAALELELEAGAGATPVELTTRLAGDDGPSLTLVSYHVRRLRDAGGLELVEERAVRGAVEHVYRVTPAGRALGEDDALEVAVAALERIRAEPERSLASTPGTLGASTARTMQRIAGDALAELGRRAPSSVAA